MNVQISYLGSLQDARLVGPLAALAVALAVEAHLMSAPAELTQDGFGPLFWPRLMALGCAISALMLCLLRGWQYWRAPSDVALPSAAGGPAASYDDRMMWLGLAGIGIYGLAINTIGFAFATALLLAYWLLLNGIRRPATILLTAVLGPVVMLYVFVKVAYTPLPRGSGLFDTLSIALYRLLGIF